MSKFIKYWAVLHNVDIIETGECMNLTYIKTMWVGFPAQQAHEKNILEDFCFSRFGARTQYVQGVGPSPGWSLFRSSPGEFESSPPKVWGGIATKTRRVILEIGAEDDLKVIFDKDSGHPLPSNTGSIENAFNEGWEKGRIGSDPQADWLISDAKAAADKEREESER